MISPRLRWAALCLTGIIACISAHAATITHTNVPDFQTGISDGIVQTMMETSALTSPEGAVGLLPGLGDVVFNDNFDYNTVSEAANYLFLTPNLEDYADLTTFPSQFMFAGDTPTAPEAVAPAPGFLRIHASRPHDFYSGNPGQRSPALVINKTLLTGDFIAETRVTIRNPRSSNNYRHDGLIIIVPETSAGQVVDVPITVTTPYLSAGPFENITTDQLATVSKLYGAQHPYPTEFATRVFTGETWYIRIVKRGAYFYSYMKNDEAAPWVLQQWVKMPELANAPGLVVGMFAKSFSGATPRYQDDDFDYLKVYRIGTLAGSFSNVMDAGEAADWQTVSLNTNSKELVKYQLRAGNTLAAGTLTDAGSFVGPDGTSATFFTDDAAQVPPGAAGKRYLEYKLFVDAATSPTAGGMVPINLPPFVRSVSAVWRPSGLGSKLLSTAAEFGADGGGIQNQPGSGDISLSRTQIYRDDFSTPTLDAGWSFDPGYTATDPNVVGDYSLTERPGYLRLKVGYPQDFYAGIKGGGVKMLRALPPGIDVSNFEVEAEINLESQQCREAVVLMAQDLNNWIGVGIGRRFENTYEIGVIEDSVLNNNVPGGDPVIMNYGSNTIQLRVARQGTWVTISVRDPASDSPSWRVVSTRNTAGAATGGTDFAPNMVGLLGKSWGKADQGAINYDVNYFRVAALTGSGEKTLTVPLPADARLDTVLAVGDGVNPDNTKMQVMVTGAGYVGPDGTSSTWFTVNEPKIPAGLVGPTSLRVVLDGASGKGTPYLHAAGIQYATGATRVARDTNALDFAGGSKDNVTTAPPGLIANAGGVTTGTPQTEEFDTAPNGWQFSNNPPGPNLANSSTYSFTDAPGWAVMNVGAPTDTWGPGTATQKPRCFLYYGTPLTGDFEIETLIDMPYSRDQYRHMGLGVVAQLTGGTPPDANLDMTNLLLFGPYHTGEIRILRGDNNVFNDSTNNAIDTQVAYGYTGYTYNLRLRKAGRLFTGSVSIDGSTYTEICRYTFSHDLGPVYVGFLSKSWYLASGQLPLYFDYLKISPLTTSGAFESRVLDLGVTGLTPKVETLGGNSVATQIRWRAADTLAGLETRTFTGPDGTTNSYYEGTYTGSLPAEYTGKRYFQYRAILPFGAQLNDIAVVGIGATSPLTSADVAQAVRIAAGLATASPADLARLDVVKGVSSGIIGLVDAVAISRTVNGL